ncbi:hemolymph lipopolysaccharide-binding protein [Diprion similis]|uniref:hemolymph lipopolysaccharide-binding protein n=1 Tax=Diprion similis TaxID=362088 RepID=UPI001EF8C0E8|nr:hemolymph lipopolysaccharide-binding protein [Diprion similis]
MTHDKSEEEMLVLSSVDRSPFLACQLMCSANSSNENLTFVQNTPSSEQLLALPTGYVAFPDIGVAYKSYKADRVTWNEARKLCMLDDATLAVIHSSRMHDHVMSVKSWSNSPHLGHHRLFDRGEWTNVKNGRPMSLLPWAPAEPNQGPTFNCGSMWHDGRGLVSIPCDEKRSFICEIPITKDGRQISPNPYLRINPLS